MTFCVITTLSNLGRISYEIVAAHDDVLPPPQNSAGDDEVLLLRLVAEQPPLSGGDAVVSEASASGHSQVLGGIVHGGILE